MKKYVEEKIDLGVKPDVVLLKEQVKILTEQVEILKRKVIDLEELLGEDL